LSYLRLKGEVFYIPKGALMISVIKGIHIKNLFYTKRNELKVKEFMEQIKRTPVERLVYPDESGVGCKG
jgi:hypothetical protein